MDYQFLTIYPDNKVICRICRRRFEIIHDDEIQAYVRLIHSIVCTTDEIVPS